MLLLTLETFIATAAFKKYFSDFSKFFYSLCSQLPFFIVNTKVSCLMQDESTPSCWILPLTRSAD